MKTSHVCLIIFLIYSNLSFSQECNNAIRDGEGTFYGGIAGSSGGNCSLPVAAGDIYHCAMNHTDYDGSNACGACIEVTGPNGTITLKVVDRCPECAVGDVDMTQEAFAQIANPIDGRVPISWKYVPCDLDTSTSIKVHFKEGSSEFWTAIQLRDIEHAVATLEYEDTNGDWVSMPRQNYNFFLEAGGISSPMKLRATPIIGTALIFENIPIDLINDIDTEQQFITPPECLLDCLATNEYCFEINCAADIIVDADPMNCNAAITIDTPTLNGGFSKTALNFDGVNDQVVVANGFTNDLSEVTMEVKVNFDAIGGWDTLLNYTNWTAGYLHFQLDGSGRLGWSVNGNSPTDQYIDLGLQTGVWYNLAVTYSISEKKMSFYLDGVLQDERTYATAIPLLADKQFAIGKWSSRLLDGSIDDFRVWGVVKTETEIQTMLDKPLSGNEANLVAYYNFNEGEACEDNTGVIAIIDQTGNHNATLSGFALTDTMTCESNYITGTINDYVLVNDYNNSSVLNETFPVGTTTVIWTATNSADNTIETCTQNITVTDNLGTCTVSIAPVMFLEGAMESVTGGLMRDDLRSNGLIPLTSPYSDAVTVDQTVLDVTGTNAIVDWVWLELRDATDNTMVIAGQSALLQRDGDIVSVDGTSDVIINEAPGDYYIVVKHRSHLGIITNQAITLSSMTTMMDFAASSTLVAGGDLSMTLLTTGEYAITVGDFDGNGQVQSTDLSSVISQLGMSGYMEADMDMNGQIQTIDINSLLIPNIGKGSQVN